MAIYFAAKEIWRGKGRFLLFSLVIALITVLVLFIAGLAEGLASANKEYIERLDGELVVFQENVELSTVSSRIGESKTNSIKRVNGVDQVGPVGLSAGTIIAPNGNENTDVALIGFVPGLPGGANVLEGENLKRERAYETVIDQNVARQTGLDVGDVITLKTIQGTEEEFFTLEVVGISDGRQYFFQPSIFVSTKIWERIRPQSGTGTFDTVSTYNIMNVKVSDPTKLEAIASEIESEVDGVEVVDRVTAYESAPGYSEQQGTLNTQRGFTLLIGILVIGGFFQIQTLQKVPNIGMLKAIGASNGTIATSVVLQITLVTAIGVVLGSIVTLLLSYGLPAGIPIRFSLPTILAAVSSLLIIGPLGGLVSVRSAIKVEPLIALGLNG
jgi:putative ABC transport system permease protein